MEHWKRKNKQGEKRKLIEYAKRKITTILQIEKINDVQDEKNAKQQKSIKRHLHIKGKR